MYGFLRLRAHGRSCTYYLSCEPSPRVRESPIPLYMSRFSLRGLGLSILLDGDPQISYLILLVLTRLVPIYIILLSRLSQARSVERVEGNRTLLLRALSNRARHFLRGHYTPQVSPPSVGTPALLLASTYRRT